MRVGIVLEQALGPVPGGIGRAALELAAALARTAGPADSVTSTTAWHRDVSAAVVAGVAGPRRLPLPARPLAVAWSRGVGPVPARADVVHAPSLLLPPRWRTRPRVVMIHDAVPWTHPETLTPHGVRWHVAMAQRAVRTGAHVVTPTRTVADQLRGVLAGLDEVTVLGAGVSAQLRTPPSPQRLAETRRRLGLPERFLLSLATLEPRKGLDVAIAALGRLGARGLPLLVAGQPGWGGVDLAASARTAGLPDGSVRALGRVSDDDLRVLLHDAQALLAPSRAEGFGLPVAEAMAAGTPVIVSDAPALVEVAGGAALVTPVGDDAALAGAVEALIGSAAERERLAAAGRVRAAAFDWDVVAGRAWELYRRIG